MVRATQCIGVSDRDVQQQQQQQQQHVVLDDECKTAHLATADCHSHRVSPSTCTTA